MKNNLTFRFFIGFVGLIIFFSPLSSVLFAQGKLDVESQSYQFDSEKQQYVYLKPVVRSEDLTINGNRLEYSEKEKRLLFSGNVVATTSTVFMTAERAEYDQSTEVLQLFNATLFDRQRGAYVKANHIERPSKDQFVISDATVTLCNPEDPAWEIKSSRIVYNIDNYAYSTHTFLTMEGAPILYLPAFSWPTQKGRASGVLTPVYLRKSLSDTSKKYGNRLQIPYFIAIDKDQDATVTADIIEFRGVGVGLEYQYAFIEGMTGQFTGWYLDEMVRDRNLYDENISGYDGTGAYDKQPTRYKFTFDHKQNIFLGGSLIYNQYRNSDNEINKEYFNSSVSLDTHEHKEITLSFPFYRGSLSLSATQIDLFLDESIYDTDTDKDTHLNKMPSMAISQTFSQIWDTSLSLNFSNIATEYERKFGWDGFINQLAVTATAPFTVDFLNFYPEYEKKHFYYDVKYTADPAGTGIDEEEKQAYTIDRKKVGVNFEIFRYFYNDKEEKNAKLSFIPTVIYEQLDDVEQARADILGGVYGRKSMTYNLTTKYTTKDLETESVRNVATLTLSQIYDLYRDHEFKGPQTSSSEKETLPGDTQLPLRLTLDISPISNFSTTLFYRYDWNNQSIVERTFSLSNSSEGNSFSLSYNKNTQTYYTLDRLYKPEANSYSISHYLKLPNNFDLSLSGTWDMERSNLAQRYADSGSIKYLDRQLTNANATLTYTHSCYKFLLSYMQEIESRVLDGVTEEYLENTLTFTFTISSWPGESPYTFDHLFNN